MDPNGYEDQVYRKLSSFIMIRTLLNKYTINNNKNKNNKTRKNENNLKSVNHLANAKLFSVEALRIFCTSAKVPLPIL
jgi:hypothetical protein